jgi:hypothetical protein
MIEHMIETFTNVRTGKVFVNTSLDIPEVNQRLLTRVTKHFLKDTSKFVVKRHMTSDDVELIHKEYLHLIKLVNIEPKKSYHIKRELSDATKKKLSDGWAANRETRSMNISKAMKRHHANKIKTIPEPKVKRVNTYSVTKQDVIDLFDDADDLNKEVVYSLGISVFKFRKVLVHFFGTSSYKKVRTMLND